MDHQYPAHLQLVPMGNDIMGVLRSWRKWQEAQGLSPRTIQDREYVLTHFFERTSAGPLDITPEHVIEFIGRPGLNQSSRSTYHKHLRAYSRWLVRTGRRENDPTAQTPVPRQPKGTPRPVSDGDLALILKACNRRRTKMMVLLASLQGLRIHEIAKIRGEDVDARALTLTVTGKGGKTAVLPLHQTVAMFATAFPSWGPWFPFSTSAEPIAANGVGKAIRSAMRRAGVQGTPHQLRHWYGSTLVHNGVDLRTVQELLRHESLATTQIYTQVRDKDRRNAIDTLSIVA